MERRAFLRQVALYGAALTAGLDLSVGWCREGKDSGEDVLAGMRIIDPHAHPDMDALPLMSVPTTSWR